MTGVERNRTTRVGNDETHVVHGKLQVKVAEKEYTIDVEKGFMTVIVHHDNHTTQAKNIFEPAAEAIELTVPGSSIKMGPAGIVIDGQGVTARCG